MNREAPLTLTAVRNNSSDDSGGPKANAPRPSSFAGKIGALFEDKLETSRGRGRIQKTIVLESGADPNAGVMAPANPFRSARSRPGDCMMVPEGVVIEGSLDAEADAEISGRVNGNVSVARRLRLGPSGCIMGDVRCHKAHIDGVIEGRTECGDMLDLGPTGRLKADAMSGASMTLAGEVHGNLNCGGKLHLTSTGVVNGNIRSRTLRMDEGAVLNGMCSTRDPDGEAAGRSRSRLK